MDRALIAELAARPVHSLLPTSLREFDAGWFVDRALSAQVAD